QTVAKPDDQKRLQQEGQEGEKQLNEARKLFQAGKYAEAAATCREGLKRKPDSVAFQTLLNQSEEKVRQAGLEVARRPEAERARAEAEKARQRQHELARQAEAARTRTEQEAKATGDAERRAREQKRHQAADGLFAQARQAMQQNRYPQAVQLYESALALE